ncbi:Uncharacterized protein APZ42_008114, partial [Daphnia magna]
SLGVALYQTSHQTSITVSENPDSIANRTSPRATVVAVLGGCSPSSAPPRHSGVSVPDLSIPGSFNIIQLMYN